MAPLQIAGSRKWSALVALVTHAFMTGCGNGAAETSASAAEVAPQPESPVTRARPAGPPLGPSLWVLLDRGPIPEDPELVQAIARLDPATGDELDRIVEIGYNPADLTYADGTLCVHNIGYSSITCVDAATHETVRTLEFGNGFLGYGRGSGALWATEMATGLLRIDAASGKPTHRAADVAPKRFSFTDDAVWALNTSGGIRRMDPASGATLASVPPLFDDELFMPVDIAAAPNAVWVSTSGGQVLRVEPATNEVVAALGGADPLTETHVLVGGNTRIVADGAGAWIAGLESGTLLRIDAAANATSVVEGLQPPVRDIALGIDEVWVLHGDVGRITRIDPVTGTARRVAEVGSGAVGLIAC